MDQASSFPGSPLNHQPGSQKPDSLKRSHDALWLTISPHLRRFDRRLQGHLADLTDPADLYEWEYQQAADEPCCLDTVLQLLDEYLQDQGQPMHLLGHGMSGVVGLLYARLHPERVASLTLLSVGANPHVNWHAHYYALRSLLPCKRQIILVQVARLLLGAYPASTLQNVATMLEKDLDECLTLHSLAKRKDIKPGRIAPPLLVCQGEQDVILDPYTQMQWQQFLKPGDRLWQCPEGRHFFHYEYPSLVANTIAEYWQQLSQTAPSLLYSA